MGTATDATYEAVAQDYLTKLRAWRAIPPAATAIATRGAGEVAADTLIAQADQIAEVSARLVPLARAYLAAPDPVVREGISGHLLAQAAAEFQVATELLTIAAGEQAGAGAPITRAVRGATLRDAIDGLEQAMAAPVSTGLIAPAMVRRGVVAAATSAEAKQALMQAATVTAAAIAQRVVEVGGDLAFNLVFQTEWAAVIESAGLLSRDVATLLDRIKEGTSELIQRAVTVATRTLLNVYDKLLALLGNDVEDQARQRIAEWLATVEQAGKIELFQELVGRLYRVDALEAALADWLAQSTAEVKTLNATTSGVTALSDKFAVLVKRMNTVGDVIGLARFIQVQFPPVLVVVTGIRVALLAVLVYAGYDYIGYDQPAFANLTRGVGEMIRDNLGVAG